MLYFEDWATSFASYLSKQKIQPLSLQKLSLYPVLYYFIKILHNTLCYWFALEWELYQHAFSVKIGHALLLFFINIFNNITGSKSWMVS